MTTGSAVGIGAIIAALIAGWNNAKEYLFKLSGFFLHRISFDEITARKLAQLMIQEHWKSFPNKYRHVHMLYKYVSSKQEMLPILHENIASRTERVLFRKGFQFISMDVNNTSIIAPKFVNIDNIIKRATDINKIASLENITYFWTQRIEGSRFFKDFSSNKQSENSNYQPSPRLNSNMLMIEREDMCWPIGIDKKYLIDDPHRTVNNLWMSDEMKKIIQEAKSWKEKRKWFLERSVPWKRGFLFYGKPGTGKSKLALSIAQELRIPLFIFDLTSMTNSDLVNKYKELSVETGRVVLIEDMDAVFDKRNNTTSTQQFTGVTFDCLLNVIDGVETSNGTIIIITTNDISKLDEALIRAGRIDRKVELNGLNREGRLWMANKIFKGFEKDLWINIIEQFDDHTTGAVFQEACCRRAMELFWREDGL